MKNREFTWNAADRFKLFARVWESEEAPVGVISLVQGLGEHSGRYDHWAKRYVEKGFAFVGFDLRGHCNSQGNRGAIMKFNDLLDDIDQLIKETEKLFPDIPVFLYGHSLGGNLVLNYTLRRKPFIKGVIATSPWLRLVEEVPSYLMYLAQVLRFFVPFVTMDNKLDPTHISRDKEMVDRYVSDTLVHNRISVELFLGALNAAKWSVLHAREFHLPVFLMHGTGDKIVSHKGTEAFAAKIDELSTYKSWEGAYHELHHEDIADELFNSQFEWIEKVLKE